METCSSLQPRCLDCSSTASLSRPRASTLACIFVINSGSARFGTERPRWVRNEFCRVNCQHPPCSLVPRFAWERERRDSLRQYRLADREKTLKWKGSGRAPSLLPLVLSCEPEHLCRVLMP